MLAASLALKSSRPRSTIVTSLVRPGPSPLKHHWLLDPEVVFLNHGSFGACPIAVLEHQQELRREMERHPITFFVRELGERIEPVRERVAAFVGADPSRLMFVENATTGVNTALQNLGLKPGDELLVTDHEYGACRNAANVIASRAGATVREFTLPFPLTDAGEVLEALEAAITPKTRALLIDHVTSKTGLVLPIKQIVEMMNARDIDTVIDGAHAPGMLPLELDEIGATFYTGNCHKWICSPKSCAILYVREDRKHALTPPMISHGESATHIDAQQKLFFEFDWLGTRDLTPLLCIPRALDVMSTLAGPGGWEASMAHNHDLVLRGREILCEKLEIDPPAPEDMIGSLAAFPLPEAIAAPPTPHPLYLNPVQDQLRERYGVEVPIAPWPDQTGCVMRISAQLYNHLDEYRYLAAALEELLANTDR